MAKRTVDWNTFPRHLVETLPIGEEQLEFFDREQVLELREREWNAIAFRIAEMRKRMIAQDIPLTGWLASFAPPGLSNRHTDLQEYTYDELRLFLDEAAEVLDGILREIRERFAMHVRRGPGFPSSLSFPLHHPHDWDDAPGMTLAFLLQQQPVYRAHVFPDGPFIRSAAGGTISSEEPPTAYEEHIKRLHDFLGFENLDT